MVRCIKCPDCGVPLGLVGQSERFYRRSDEKDVLLLLERFGWEIKGDDKRHYREGAPEHGECAVLHIAVVREVFVPHDENRKFEGDTR